MLFNSLVFLYAFLPITYKIFWQLQKKRQRYIWLTLASYVFYGYWNYKFCLLMLLSTGVSYLAGRGLGATESPALRRFLLIVPITFDLLLLGFFKYANFFFGFLGSFLHILGVASPMKKLDILLPIGISFYTFHTISYIVDSYRRTITPTKNFWEFACYVSLFSQLVAGPIVRFREVEGDLENINKDSRSLYSDRAWSFFVLGFAKKVVIADSIALVIDPAWTSTTISTIGAWLCVLGYAYQLYFDFSGYSDMAVGLGLLFGIRLPQNFSSPYRADSITDFWRRWHMSLSSCLRDYLYIPLGGNRCTQWRVDFNLMIVMLIGGLWHGANWTFIAWGCYHGCLLVLSKRFQFSWVQNNPMFRRIGTFFMVTMGWVLFRSANMSTAFEMFRKMYIWHKGELPIGYAFLVGILVPSALIAHVGPNTFDLSHQWNSRQALALACLFLVSLTVLYGQNESPFLYFQF